LSNEVMPLNYASRCQTSLEHWTIFVTFALLIEALEALRHIRGERIRGTAWCAI